MRLYKIKKSKIDKNGLYANCDIQKGTKIIEYKGKIISVKKSAQDPKFDNGKAIYLFNINRRFDLDGDFKFNTARLINHSCSPNCEVLGEGLKIWIYAIKNIKKGDELSYDYGYAFDKDDYKDHVCKCSSKFCIGYIISSDHWPKLLKYLEKNVIDFEPKIALLAGSKGIDSFKVIINQFFKYLRPNGMLLLEIGSTQKKIIEKIFHYNGYNKIEFFNDLSGKCRGVCVKKDA